MTFRELKDTLIELSDDQLDMTAIIHVSHDNEYFAVKNLAITDEVNDDGVLDMDHPYFVI